MRIEILFNRPADCTDHSRHVVVDNLEALGFQKARVYRTFVPANEKWGGNTLDFVFTTTHKDTHLELGRLDRVTQYHLALLLEEMFKNGAVREIMLLKRPDEKEGWLMTRTQEGFDVTFTWSPAL